ncbi:MAG TPA: hypothetical protein VE377_27265 [Candidatus Dormibacteraeota bacterium]|nr:hypothetical protein [Candidatus Dormibacteraeota bacterium]
MIPYLRLSVLLIVAVIFGSVSFAQDVPEFKVESNQVLVPVNVLNFSGEEPSDLTEKDFRLFEDGKKQRIRLRFLRSDVRDFSDNLGGGIDLYSYYSTKARWTTFGGPAYWIGHFYLLTYVPPPSPEGSCHEIKLKTSRRAWFAFAAMQEYCNTRHATYDTFNGTALDKKMEQYATSGNTGKLVLTLGANFAYTASNTARADIILEFPVGMKFANKNDEPDYGIQVLGLLYRKNGSLAARFSDRRECFPVTWLGQEELDLALETAWCKATSPYRYEVQLDVPPGEYQMRAVVSDGKNFGVSEVPLVIEKFSGKQLAISGIALCKRFHSFSDLHPHTVLHRHATLAQEVLFSTDLVPLVSKGIEFTPVADTSFHKTDPLVAYFEVYEPLLASQPPPKVQVHLRIVDSKTGVVADDFEPVDVAPYIESGNSSIHISRKIPLDKLAPGAYRLEVQAVDSSGSTGWRSVDFAVN